MTSPEKGSARVIGMDELKDHCSIDDAWLLIDGTVYDVTQYLDRHPAGAEILLDYTSA